MGAALYLLAVLAAGPLHAADAAGSRQAPTYSAASIVNAASNAVGALAPNTFATIYGANLAYATRAMAPEDIRSGKLPTELAGVRVLVDSIPAVIYYVSPGQINLLIPNMLRRPEAELRVTLDGTAGPAVVVKLLDVAPTLFQWGPGMVVATRADWSAITEAAPALPGQDVILFATGLGETDPETAWGQAPLIAARIKRLIEFQVLLGGVTLDPARIFYAGVAPGFAGLYQINLRLPERLDSNPEVRIVLGSQTSPAGLRLPVRGGESR